MNDCLLWQRLGQTEWGRLTQAQRDELLTGFQAAKTFPIEQRSALWGRIGPALEHQDPLLREAAMGLLEDATGAPAFMALVKGLKDPDTRVQEAAFQSLRSSCRHDHLRWFHALLHEAPERRQQAILSPPEGFEAGWFLWLLPDTDNRESVLDALQSYTPAPSHLPIAISLAQSGLLPRELYLEMLLNIDWTRRGEEYLRALPTDREEGWPYVISLPQETKPLEAFLTSTTAGNDQLDTFHLLLWEELGKQPTSPQTKTLASALLRELLHWTQKGHIPLAIHQRMAYSIGRVGFHEWLWQPEWLALCAVPMPALLLHHSIPLHTRKQAAHLLIGIQKERPQESFLEAFLQSNLCYNRGQLDLETIGGLLHLLPEKPYMELLQFVRSEDLKAALCRHPEEAPLFLSRPPQTNAERSLHHKLLRAILSVEASPSYDLLAKLALTLSADRLDFLTQLEHYTKGATLTTLSAILKLLEEQSVPTRRLQRIAEQCEGALKKQPKETLTFLIELVLDIVPDIKTLPTHWLALQDSAEIIHEPDTPHEGLSFTDTSVPASPAWKMLFRKMPDLSAPQTQAFALASELLTDQARHQKAETFLKAVTALDEEQLIAFLVLEQLSPQFPFDHERALGRALQESESEVVRAWLEHIVMPAKRKLTLVHKRGAPKALSADRIRALKTAKGSALEEALEICYQHPITGLCKALEGRSDQAPQLAIASALLLCHDPAEEVAPWFEIYCGKSKNFLHKLDIWMVERCERMDQMSLLGSAWLHRWEAHHKQFQSQIEALGTGLDLAMDWALGLASPQLTIAVWKGLRLSAQKWRWNDVEQLRQKATDRSCLVLEQVLLAGLTKIEAEWPRRWSQEELDTLKAEAAWLLSLYKDCQAALEASLGLRATIMPHLLGFAPKVKLHLSHWLNARDRISYQSQTVTYQPYSDKLIQQIRRSKRLPFLTEHCVKQHPQVIEEAVSQLLMLEEPGIKALLSLLQKAQETELPTIRSISATIALWPDTFDLGSLFGMAKDPETPVSKRFLITVGLHERTGACWQELLDFLNTPADTQWLQLDDWRQLQSLQEDPLSLALSCCTSTQHMAYSQSVQLLLDQEDPLPQKVLGGMVRFLQSGGEKLLRYRLDVAQRLKRHARFEGLPLLFSHRFSAQNRERSNNEDFFVSLPPQDTYDLIEAGMVAGPTHLDLYDIVAALGHQSMQRSTQQKAALLVLKHTAEQSLQQKALSLLKASAQRRQTVRQLAEVFAWGVKRGRELTGRLFRIEMIGGSDLGYTRLDHPSIYINPLPMLRKVQHGEDIVKALILHEFGHHIYHADAIGLETWEQARKEKLGRVLNLVSDEQLERSLRAKEPLYGNQLKQLAAYAFQHADRELHIGELLNRLGPRGFQALCGNLTKAARQMGHVHLNVGELLFELEAQGMSFARFVRALRMGLGNRHNDPKVERALRLFRAKSFRHSTMPEMLEISRALRQIFGHELEMLELLCQHSTTGSDGHEVIETTEGLSQEELQKEIERVLQGKKRASEGPPVRTINVSPDETFRELHTVVPLQSIHTEQRAYAVQTARWSARMRTYLHKLGLGMVPQKRRLRGHQLDRGQIKAAVIRHDPRVLVARQKVYHTDLFLGILIDCSGSMQINDNIERAKLFASMMAEAAAPIKGIDARFFGFTDAVLFDAGTAKRCAVHALEADGGNNDAGALWHVMKLALASPRKAKLLVMISDGSPTECSIAALRALVTRATQRMGLCCAQIALRPLDELCFPHYVEVMDDELDLSIQRFGSIIAQLIQRTISP